MKLRESDSSRYPGETTVEIPIPLNTSVRELVRTLLGVRKMYTQCWLQSHGRMKEMFDYTSGMDPRFDVEAGLKMYTPFEPVSDGPILSRNNALFFVPLEPDPRLLQAIEMVAFHMTDHIQGK